VHGGWRDSLLCGGILLQVLPLYIVVMMAHQTQEKVVAENLEAFLGNNATEFTAWWVAAPHVLPCLSRVT